MFVALLAGVLLGCTPAVAPKKGNAAIDLIQPARVDDRSLPCKQVEQSYELNLTIGARGKKCIWRLVDGKIHLYQHFAMNHRDISVAITINPAAPSKAAVHFIGGPGGSIYFEHFVRQPTLNNALTNRYRYVYTVGYSGTGASTSLEDGEIDTAAAEGAELIRRMKKSKITPKIDVIGSSMGAHVSAKSLLLLNEDQTLYVANLYLLAPLMCSASKINKFFVEKSLNGPKFSEETMGVVIVHGKTGEEIDFQIVKKYILWRKFFGRENFEKDLDYYLIKLKIKPKIIFGSLDRRIYCGDAFYLKKYTDKYQTTIIPELDHTPASWNQFAKMMHALK
jgi:pimeloyl-ACP methyl ester carboxylesterase